MPTSRWRYRREFELINLQKKPDPAKIELKAAAEDVARALQRTPEAVDVLLAAADVERLKFDNDRKNNPDGRTEARRHLTHGLELQAKLGPRGIQSPAQFQLLWQLTYVLLEQRQDEQTKEGQSELQEEAARRIAEMRRIRLKPESMVPAAADYLQARLHVINEEFARAEPLLTRSRTVLENQSDLGVQINLLLGACYNRLENPIGMLDAYDRVLKMDPNSTAAMLGVSAARRQLGQADKSLEAYKDLMKLKGAPSSGWVDIARMEMEKQLQAAKSGRKWEDAEKALKQAEETLVDSPLRDRAARQFDLTLLRAEILVAQEKPDEAERLLIEARDRPEQGKRLQYWAALVELAEFRKDRAKAKALLAEAEKEKDAVDLRLVRARLLAADKPADLAAGSTRSSTEPQPPFHEEDQARLLAGLAEIYFRAGNTAKTREYCRRLSANPRYRSDLRLRLFVFDLALRDNARDEMNAALKEIQTVEDGASSFTRFATALMKIRDARQASPKDKARLLDEAAPRAGQGGRVQAVLVEAGRRSRRDLRTARPARAGDRRVKEGDCRRRGQPRGRRQVSRNTQPAAALWGSHRGAAAKRGDCCRPAPT